MKKTQHRDNALTKWLLVLTCLSFMSAPTVCANESLDADFGDETGKHELLVELDAETANGRDFPRPK